MLYVYVICICVCVYNSVINTMFLCHLVSDFRIFLILKRKRKIHFKKEET